MRAAVLGAAGVLGRHVVPRLIEQGHEVVAFTRNDAARSRVEAWGATGVLGDILDRESLIASLAGCDAVVNLATAVPRPGSAPDWAMNDRIRREGTETLVAACRTAGVGRLIQQSIAMLQANGRDMSDEDTPPLTNPVTASALDMEASVRASGLDWCLLRGGLFYGPDTGREQFWLALVADPDARLPGDGSDYLSLVHVVDMAAAVVRATEAAAPGSTYAAVDDEPVTYRMLLGHIAARAGRPVPPEGGKTLLPSFRVNNSRIRDKLGWEPMFPTFRSGLASLEGVTLTP